MAGYKTAFLVVRKDWFGTPGIRHMLNEGRPVVSSGETHMIIAPIRDTTDPHGVWLKQVTSKALRQDGAETKLEFMVPWSEIVALAVVPEENVTPMGFQPNSSTSVFGG